MGTFPPPALRTRRADFRHRALQWNHAARTRVPGHDQRAGLASRGTKLAPLRRPAGASSGLLTPWRQRPFGSSPSLVHVMTSGISAHLRGTRPSATPVSLLPFAIAVHLRSLPSAGITRFPRCRVGGGAPRGRWPPSAAQTVRAVFPHTAFTKTSSRDEDRWKESNRQG